MSGGTRIPLAEAKGRAEEIAARLQPYCRRLVIAGSIRREKSMIGDIELVVEPLYDTYEQRVNLFDYATVTTCNLEQQIKTLWENQFLRPAQNKKSNNIAWSTKWQAESRYFAGWWCGADHDPIRLDIFIQRPDRLLSWGWQLFLRTGPAACNQLMVTSEKQAAWLETYPGQKKQFQGLLPTGFIADDGGVRRYGGELVPLETEQAVFDLWNMAYVEPKRRTPENYRDAKRK